MPLQRLVLLAFAVTALSGCQDDFEVRRVGTLKAPPPIEATNGSYLDQGRYYLRNGDPNRARRAFIRSLRTEGETVAALTGVGVSFERQRLLKDAHRYFERAKELEPESTLVRNNLGTVYYRMGDYEAARREFQAAFALSSGTNTVAGHNLGLSERAIAAAAERTVPIVPNPHQLQREGLGEYRLRGAQPSITTDNGARHAG